MSDIYKFLYDPDKGGLTVLPPIPPTINVEKAFELSIKKWEVMEPVSDIGHVHDGGVNTCGLCALYYRRSDKQCSGKCPIVLDTGMQACKGTPYKKWKDSRSRRDARAMVDYLKGLRDRYIAVDEEAMCAICHATLQKKYMGFEIHTDIAGSFYKATHPFVCLDCMSTFRRVALNLLGLVMTIRQKRKAGPNLIYVSE